MVTFITVNEDLGFKIHFIFKLKSELQIKHISLIVKSTTVVYCDVSLYNQANIPAQVSKASPCVRVMR